MSNHISLSVDSVSSLIMFRNYLLRCRGLNFSSVDASDADKFVSSQTKPVAGLKPVTLNGNYFTSSMFDSPKISIVIMNEYSRSAKINGLTWTQNVSIECYKFKWSVK